MNLRHLLLLFIFPGMCLAQPIQITHDDSLYHHFQNAILSPDGQLIVPLAAYDWNNGAPPGGSIIAFDTATLAFSETNLGSPAGTNFLYVAEWIYPSGTGYLAFGQALDTLTGDIQMLMLELDQSLSIIRDTLFGQDTFDEVITGVLPLDSSCIISYYASDTIFPQSYEFIEVDQEWNIIRSCEPPNTTIIHSMTYNEYTNKVIMLTMNSNWYELDYNSFDFDTLPHTYPTSFNFGGNFITTRGAQGYYQSGYYLNESAHLPNEGWRGACVLRDTLGQIIQFNPVGFASDTPGISAARSVLVNSYDTVFTASLAAPEFATDPWAFPIFGSNYYSNSWIDLCCHTMNGQIHWETRIGGGYPYEPNVLVQGTNNDYYVLGMIDNSSPQTMSQAIFVVRIDGGGNIITSSSPVVSSLKLSVYPNPADEILRIELKTDVGVNEECAGIVFDMQGRVTDGFVVPPAGGSFSLNVSDYTAGAYLLKIRRGNTELTRKFLVK